MITPTDFTPGPSQLYFTVEGHARSAFREGIPSISHRSKKFQDIYQQTTTGLKNLLNIPDNFSISFCSSATEIWERSIQNLVAENCLHLVNGAFSKKFYETAIQLRKKAIQIEVASGQGFDELKKSGQHELIAITQNETSTGVSLPLEFIHNIKTKNPEALIVVDAVSSMPYPTFDYSKIDSIFFSVQKGFGMPAGLGVWIYNQRCLQKSRELQAKGISTGSYHNLLSLHEFTLKNQTPETPNVFAIYLLNKVVTDLLHRGINTLRKETEYKAAILYQALDKHTLIKPFVHQVNYRSQTVIVADCGSHIQPIREKLNARGLNPGEGYGEFKKTQLRFANFPAHSKEQYELLVDVLMSLHP